MDRRKMEGGERGRRRKSDKGQDTSQQDLG
jgi:hypothetical protein